MTKKETMCELENEQEIISFFWGLFFLNLTLFVT